MNNNISQLGESIEFAGLSSLSTKCISFGICYQSGKNSGAMTLGTGVLSAKAISGLVLLVSRLNTLSGLVAGHILNKLMAFLLNLNIVLSNPNSNHANALHLANLHYLLELRRWYRLDKNN